MKKNIKNMLVGIEGYKFDPVQMVCVNLSIIE